MFKFNKNNELLETIENQKVQISRYESRLSDLVSAYKSLQNEKQALEASVKALSASPKPGRKYSATKLSISSPDPRVPSSVEEQAESQEIAETVEDNPSTEGSHTGEDEQDAQAVEKIQQLSQDDEKDLEEELDHLRHQIATLTHSLSTVTQEKSKIVATYQAEKKKLKTETERQLDEGKAKCKTLKTKLKEFEEDLCRAKDKIKREQEDREQEQSTHSIMLRELQKMLNDEREKREQVMSELQEARRSLSRIELDARKSENSEKRISSLNKTLEETQDRLKQMQEEVKKPSPMAVKLQQDFAEMKALHRVRLEKARMQMTEAEERLKMVTMDAEERVSSLENQVTQLSNQMGGYESIKLRDQITIQKHKERLLQMETENNILAKQAAKATSDKSEQRSTAASEDDLDIEELKNRIVRYKSLLTLAVQRSNEPIDMMDFSTALDSGGEGYQKLYLENQQELYHLREEFEKYKIRAQSVLKTKTEMRSGAESDSIRAVANEKQLRLEIEEIKERHFNLVSKYNDLEEKNRVLIKQHGEEMMTEHLKHQKNLESEKEIFSSKALELEHEMRSQRERTVGLLAEKDKEVEQLKAYMSAYHREYQNDMDDAGQTRHHSRTRSNDYVFYAPEEYSREVSLESMTEMLGKAPGHDTTTIHYAEQLARKDITINGLRKQKKQLEKQIRNLQEVISTKDEKNSREIAISEERIDTFRRNKSRENANLEYLKNVVFQFLTTNRDSSARNQMLHAVTTILHFSPEEKKKVLRNK